MLMVIVSSQPDNVPVAKKRKLGPGNVGMTPQSSFADVLERLKEDHVGGNGESITMR